MSSALATVQRIRLMAVDEAKRALAEALRVEEAARHAADVAAAQIGIEGEIAADLDTGDGAVEAYAAWLPIGRANAERTRAMQEQSSLDVARARAGLSVARSGAEAVGKLIEQKAAEAALLAERRSQAAMDEVAIQQAARRRKG